MISNIWPDFLNIIKEEVGSRVVDTWFKAVSLHSWDVKSKTVYLTVPNDFVRDWISSKYLELIKNNLARLINDDIHNIKLVSTSFEILNNVEIQPATVAKSTEIKPEVKNCVAGISKQTISFRALFKFGSFVTGPDNHLAYSASLAVSDKPGVLYNPLFIYGKSGLGKTHLLNAIGNSIKEKNSKSKVLYQSADGFVSEFVSAIRFDKVAQFEQKYKQVDVLLLDDIQFISNKEQTQEIFFHIFNSLYENRKQVVFSSDSMAKDIQGLADRLKSRLDSGMVVDINTPSLETKMAILRKKAEFHSVLLFDEVSYLIANAVESNIRELEGILIRVMAYSSLTGSSITRELVEKILSQLGHKKDLQVNINLENILNTVALYYGYTDLDLKSSKRSKDISLVRHISMYCMRKFTEKSLIEIGSFLGRKDHTTVLHAIEKIENLIKYDKKFCDDLGNIKKELLKSK